MYGGDGHDLLVGLDMDNYMNGGPGRDILYSKTHPSSISGTTSPSGQDTLIGGPAHDTFWIGPSVDGP